MIEPEPPPPGYRQGPRPLPDADQRCRIVLGRERRLTSTTFEGSKTQDAVIVRQRAAEIARLEHDRTEPDVCRQTVAGRRNGEVVGGHLGLPNPLSLAILPPPRTGVRVAEGAGLENRYTCKGIVGSNPTLSAVFPPQRTRPSARPSPQE